MNTSKLCWPVASCPVVLKILCQVLVWLSVFCVSLEKEAEIAKSNTFNLSFSPCCGLAFLSHSFLPGTQLNEVVSDGKKWVDDHKHNL